jgi:hypothetical protein
LIINVTANAGSPDPCGTAVNLPVFAGLQGKTSVLSSR